MSAILTLPTCETPVLPLPPPKIDPFQTMKLLPETFTRNEWVHTQRFRNQTHAIYERAKPTSPAPHYEVFRITVSQAREMHGVQIEEGEYYPGASDWGKMAWTYPTFDAAMGKVKSMSVNVNKKPKPRPQ